MKILLAYDGFEHSRHALEEAANLAKDEGGTITIVSVVPHTVRAVTQGFRHMPRTTSRARRSSSASGASRRTRRFSTAIPPTCSSAKRPREATTSPSWARVA
jgi:nucleotide-binding universal stress UspA family protein